MVKSKETCIGCDNEFDVKALKECDECGDPVCNRCIIIIDITMHEDVEKTDLYKNQMLQLTEIESLPAYKNLIKQLSNLDAELSSADKEPDQEKIRNKRRSLLKDNETNLMRVKANDLKARLKNMRRRPPQHITKQYCKKCGDPIVKKIL